MEASTMGSHHQVSVHSRSSCSRLLDFLFNFWTLEGCNCTCTCTETSGEGVLSSSLAHLKAHSSAHPERMNEMKPLGNNRIQSQPDEALGSLDLSKGLESSL